MPIEKEIPKQLRYFRSVDDIRDFYARLNGMQGDGEEVGLIFDIDYYSEDVCTKIVEISKKTSDRGYLPTVHIGNNNLEFSKEEMECLVSCEENLGQEGVGLYVKDGKVLYSLDETLFAYQKMQKVVDEIKSHGGSPFEKFIEIYQFVTSHVYKENEQKRYASRDLISVLNGDDIVCVGFASMLKHMCTQVGIECSIVKCDNLKEDGEMSASHACNMVYLKDSKYKIDGYYHVDATRDAIKNEKDKYKNYNFCLVPISDMEKTIKKSRYRDEMETIYHSNETEMFYELFKDSVQVEKGLRFFGLDYEKRIQVDNKKYRRDRKDAINKLTSILRDKKIPSDFYMVMKNTPVIMHPYSLMALCFDYEANKDVIDFSLNQMKVYYDALKDKNKPSEKAFVEIDNVYEFLDDALYSDYSDIEYKTAALCVLKSKNIRLLLEKSKEVREGGKPISLKKYAKAIKFSQMNAGRSEEDAENFAKLALKHSVKRSVEKFEETASNVFRTKAQELLLQNGD